jgi:hypothetical protein
MGNKLGGCFRAEMNASKYRPEQFLRLTTSLFLISSRLLKRLHSKTVASPRIILMSLA